eukprot:5854119-Pleurochrysis_carterae.AAC.2
MRKEFERNQPFEHYEVRKKHAKGQKEARWHAICEVASEQSSEEMRSVTRSGPRVLPHPKASASVTIASSAPARPEAPARAAARQPQLLSPFGARVECVRASDSVRACVRACACLCAFVRGACACACVWGQLCAG